MNTSDTSHYGKLPDGWELKLLGDIGKWQSGGTPNRSNKVFYNGNIPWLKIADLNDGYIKHASEYISEEGLENSSAKLNPKNSVCVAMYGSIGKAVILSFPATTNQAICVCSNMKCITPEFLFYYIVSQRRNLISKAGGGVQANISKKIIVKYPIPIPPIEEQQRIVKLIILRNYAAIPDDTDILITHQPPKGFLDLSEGHHYGSSKLLVQVMRIRPRVHLFGHIHDAAGLVSSNDILFSNGSVLTGNYDLNQTPINILEL